ncbi:MAG: hypothetical protein AB8B62_10770 [Roseobacter sp.]
MSAPDVNIERQKKRHHTMVKGIWIGLGIAIVVAVGLSVAMGIFNVDPTAVIPTETEAAG